MFCPSCGSTLADDAARCPGCGKNLKGAPNAVVIVALLGMIIALAVGAAVFFVAAP